MASLPKDLSWVRVVNENLFVDREKSEKCRPLGFWGSTLQLIVQDFVNSFIETANKLSLHVFPGDASAKDIDTAMKLGAGLNCSRILKLTSNLPGGPVLTS